MAGTPRPAPVTVIVPFYNGNAHLTETLRSVATQSIAPEQVLVIDDGGPQRPEIAGDQWPFELTVHMTENRGEQAARNFGAALATTDYVTFLDQDDLWLPHHIETMLAGLDDLPAGSVIAPRLHHFEDGREDEARRSAAVTGHIRFSPVTVDDEWKENASNTVFGRRVDYITWGGFPTFLRGVGDFLICARLAAAGVLYQPSAPTVLYRWHAGMATLTYQMDSSGLAARALLTSAGMGGSDPEWTYRLARLVASDRTVSWRHFPTLLAQSRMAGVPALGRTKLVVKRVLATVRRR